MTDPDRPDPDRPDPDRPDEAGLDGWAFDGEGRLVDTASPVEVLAYGPPPPVRWARPDDLGQVFGLRCALAGPDGAVHDLRCASEVYASNGGSYLNVVTEAQWYRWRDVEQGARPERIPRATCVPTRHVWIQTGGEAGSTAG